MLNRLSIAALIFVTLPAFATISILGNAAKKGHVEEVQKLVSSGADINERDTLGQTPLMLAIIADQRTTVELLVELGADVNLQDKNGNTAMHHAISGGQIYYVKFLSGHGARMRIPNRDKRDARQLADKLASGARATDAAQQILEFVKQASAAEPAPASTAAATPIPDDEVRRPYTDSYRNYDITPEKFYEAAYRALVRRGWKIERNEQTRLVGYMEKYGEQYKVQVRLIADIVDIRYVDGYGSALRRGWLKNLGKDIKIALMPLYNKNKAPPPSAIAPTPSAAADLQPN